MRVNPFYITNTVASLNQTVAKEQQLTQEASSGLRMNTISDDPAAVGQNVLLNASLSQISSFTRTAQTTQGMLQVTDSALGGVVSQLTSAISLATQGNNGTLNSSNVKTISIQLAGIRDQVLALANTTYQGRYLFAGQGTASPFSLDNTTTPATVTYSGDSNVSYLHSPNGQTIQLNVPGDQIFLAPGASVLGLLNTLVADFATGTPLATAASDATLLTAALNSVGQQRVVIDNSMTRLTAVQSYTQTVSTNLLSSQTDMMQADMATVATQLSLAETQQTALSNIIGKLQKGSLFDYL
jgi:flagellar hook-associated protein 3 FlgL